jgi:hypothetical protein
LKPILFIIIVLFSITGNALCDNHAFDLSGYVYDDTKVIICSNNKRISMHLKKNNKQYFMIDGKVEGPYDSIRNGYSFSKDGKHYAYIVEDKNKFFVVRDGKTQEEYDDIRTKLSIFTQNNSLLYLARKNGGLFRKNRWYIVKDGKEISQYKYKEVGWIISNLNQDNFSFVAFKKKRVNLFKKKYRYSVISDGKEGPLYDYISFFSFNYYNNRIHYIGMSDKKYYYINGDDISEPYDLIESFLPHHVFPNPLNPPVYMGIKGKFVYLLSENREIKLCTKNNFSEYSDYISGILTYFERIIYHKKSKSFAFKKRIKDKSTYVVNSMENTYYRDVSDFVFSADGENSAYFARMSDNSRTVILNNKQKNERYHDIRSNTLKFAPDNRRIAFIAYNENDKMFMYLDNMKSRAYDYIYDTYCFSPDSRNIMYVVAENDKDFVVIDNMECKKYDYIDHYSLTFSEDSKHYAFVAKNKDQYFVIIDGVQSKESYDSVYKVFFDDKSNVNYFCRKGRMVYLMNNTNDNN